MYREAECILFQYVLLSATDAIAYGFLKSLSGNVIIKKKDGRINI